MVHAAFQTLAAESLPACPSAVARPHAHPTVQSGDTSGAPHRGRGRSAAPEDRSGFPPPRCAFEPNSRRSRQAPRTSPPTTPSYPAPRCLLPPSQRPHPRPLPERAGPHRWEGLPHGGHQGAWKTARGADSAACARGRAVVSRARLASRPLVPRERGCSRPSEERNAAALSPSGCRVRARPPRPPPPSPMTVPPNVPPSPRTAPWGGGHATPEASACLPPRVARGRGPPPRPQRGGAQPRDHGGAGAARRAAPTSSCVGGLPSRGRKGRARGWCGGGGGGGGEVAGACQTEPSGQAGGRAEAPPPALRGAAGRRQAGADGWRATARRRQRLCRVAPAQQRPPRVRLIALAGGAPRRSQRTCLRAGADGFCDGKLRPGDSTADAAAANAAADDADDDAADDAAARCYRRRCRRRYF